MTVSHQSPFDAYLDRLKAAWNAADAHAYAAEFTEDATYVTFIGTMLSGRGEIESVHAEIFDKWLKGQKMGVKTLVTRQLNDRTASIVTAGGLAREGETLVYDKLQTFTLVRRDDRWMCAAFQNTKMNAETQAQHN
jgi:uncharacterized protein (TIGR02246 family)